VEVIEGCDFAMMPFEGGENAMRGSFQYTDLFNRLRKIREQIDAETQSWIEKGVKLHSQNDRVAANLSMQFDQCLQYFSTNPNGVTITLEMEKDNPFVWTMVRHFFLPY